MKYLHKFEELSDFTEEYMGEAYKEPWVSLTKENDKVDYNKLLGGWFRVPKYESDFYEPYLTDEEREVFSRFFDTFKVDGFDPSTSRTGTTFNVKVSPEVTVYRVGGIVDDFDPEDSSMWYEKDTNFKNVKFHYGDYQTPNGDTLYGTGSFEFDMDWEQTPRWGGDSGRDKMYLTINYDLDTKEMYGVQYWGSQEEH